MRDSLPIPRVASLSTDLLADRRSLRRTGLGLIILILVAAEPAAAQSIGESFCKTDMVTTIKNVFTVVQFGGPLIGGTMAVGATVITPTIRRADYKKELKEVRNQGIIWGVIVAPMATAIIQFILNTIVAGGASCTF